MIPYHNVTVVTLEVHVIILQRYDQKYNLLYLRKNGLTAFLGGNKLRSILINAVSQQFSQKNDVSPMREGK